jgi:hypothetical protein
LETGSHNLHIDMNDRPGVFYTDYMKSDIHVWIKTYFKSWTVLMVVVLLFCSVSTCEHILSIEGWIHSNRRNRLGQKFVESLVHTHTNLKLERLEMYETGLLPWDIEMTVEETVSDDDDGSPYRVSDSESESESELWKTLTNFLCNLE